VKISSIQKWELLFDLNAPLLSNESTVLLSCALGLGYCLDELPNSFIKRSAKGINKYIFFLYLNIISKLILYLN
jgi:hypothetical protein